MFNHLFLLFGRHAEDHFFLHRDRTLSRSLADLLWAVCPLESAEYCILNTEYSFPCCGITYHHKPLEGIAMGPVKLSLAAMI